MRIVVHHIAPGGSLDLNEKALAKVADSVFHVVIGSGRGCVLRVDRPLAGVWLPLRGRLQWGVETERLLHAGEMRVTEAEPRAQATGRGNAIWIAVLGAGQVWRNALGTLLEVPTPEPLLLPARHAADRDLRRCAIALVRATQRERPEQALDAFLEQLLALQQPLDVAIARCPGRTFAQRRQVFVRLQRVRNYLAANCQLDVDNAALARMASYSPWHFIRAFRAAYQETPHAYLVRQRLERARRLLHASPLAITEVALASGFENRCAFSRLFRQRYGVTAAALRRAAGATNERNAQFAQRRLAI